MNEEMISISEVDLQSMLNMLTYNDYAELYHKLGRAPLFEEYKEAVDIVTIFLPSIPISSLKGAFDLIGDLYSENKQCPCDKRSKFIANCDALVQMVNRQH